jgi:hemolysin D
MSSTTTAHPAAAPMRHPAIELLARYRAVFSAAWSARHALAGPKRLADEAAFLPAALEIQETPVHPAPRRAMWAIMALFCIALTWSIVGQVDIVAVAQGRIVVSDGTKLVQPLEASVVKAIRVKDGDHVAAGQVLIELDPTGANADHQNVQEQLRSTQNEKQRAQTLLAALASGLAPSKTADAAFNLQTQSEWADISARLARLDAEALRRQAELSTARELVAKLRSTLPLVQQRETDFKSLTEQGFISNHAGQDRTRERIEQERDLATQQARLKEAEAALTESRQSKTAYLAETQRTLNDRLTKATLDHAQLVQQAAKTAQREQLTTLTAPVAGTVQQLAIHSTGGVVTPAQALLVVVPDNAEVTAEVVIDNKDIGFVREGQEAQIKLETFSFTRYGTLPAKVRRVATDAITDEKRGAIFSATLELPRNAITVDGKTLKLAPGMNLTAEVMTGKRRVIEFLVDPLRTVARESMSER